MRYIGDPDPPDDFLRMLRISGARPPRGPGARSQRGPGARPPRGPGALQEGLAVLSDLAAPTSLPGRVPLPLDPGVRLLLSGNPYVRLLKLTTP